MRNAVLLFLVLVTTGLGGCQSNSSTSNFNGDVKQVKICSGFGCIYQQTLAFSQSDIAHIRSVMKGSQTDPALERSAIGELVAWKERLAQQRLRMRADTKLSYQRDSGIRGQMDCVDESSNTLAFVKFLSNENLLRHHKPKKIAERGFLFDGRYPHRTAVLTDANGTNWAFDSWKKDGGELPQVVKLSEWRLERTSEYR